MTTVILDSATARQVRESDGFVEVRDPDGKLLGQFVPMPYKKEWLDPGISQEELDRRAAEGGGRTLAEILRDLKAME